MWGNLAERIRRWWADWCRTWRDLGISRRHHTGKCGLLVAIVSTSLRIWAQGAEIVSLIRMTVVADRHAVVHLLS